MATFCCTNLVLAVTLSLMLEFAAADLQNIQNANPLNIDLSDPSQTQPTTNDNTDADDPKFGGYRPLYPPYFLRESTNVGEQQPNDQTYYDKEYYTRGTRHDERLDRNLRVPQQQVTAGAATPTVTIVRPVGFARAFPSFNQLVNSQFASSSSSSSSSSSHVASSYSFSSVRFPNT